MISRLDFFLYSRILTHLLHTHEFLLTFFVFLFVLFHSCCPHAKVFGKTLVHKFSISTSHTEWYYIFSLLFTREIKGAQRTLLLVLFLKWPFKPFNYRFRRRMHKTICGTLANSCCRNFTYGTLAQIMQCTELSPLRFAILKVP